ncbi:hypothetical protein [Terrilactibacillus laevilacticus]|uniref:Transcriptional regulator n=1 Tax=Terrilactibacillus laevilacticus TaxID=1380157 RepID=A0ABW5PLY5_9BACI|nr:hypothetical protein [Terrilactibacillus laevilacticus]
MRKGDIIQLIYLDKKNNISQRTIRVIAVSDSYIKAYCYTKKAQRIFKKENILGSKIIKRVV